MKRLILISLLIGSVGVLHAVEDWKPVFQNRAMTPEETEKIKEAMPQEAFVPPAEPRRVLIYSATTRNRHGSIPVGLAALEKMGETTGAFSAVISDDPANFEPDRLAGFDAVILLNTTGDFFMPSREHLGRFSRSELEWLQERNDRLFDNLVAYVEQGGGLVGLHAASDSGYNNERYGEMIGGYHDTHPWRSGHNVVLVVEDPEHILNQLAFEGIEDFELTEEIYQFRDPYSRDRLRILLHLDYERSQEPSHEVKREDKDFAVSWIQQFEQGRVFHSALGHNAHIFWHPRILKHFLAGIQFAVGDLEADTRPSNEVFPPSASE